MYQIVCWNVQHDQFMIIVGSDKTAICRDVRRLWLTYFDLVKTLHSVRSSFAKYKILGNYKADDLLRGVRCTVAPLDFMKTLNDVMIPMFCGCLAFFWQIFYCVQKNPTFRFRRLKRTSQPPAIYLHKSKDHFHFDRNLFKKSL